MRLTTYKGIVLTFSLAFASQIFAQGTPQSQTSTAQRIAPEAILAIQVYDVPEFSRSLRVTASGDIRLPMLKDVLHVGGLLPTEAERLIRDALMRESLVVDPFVTIAVSLRIAPGNVLAIQVNDVPEFSRSLQVTASGDIRLPMLKDALHVGGLLPTEAEKLIRDALMRESLVVDPSVSITVSPR